MLRTGGAERSGAPPVPRRRSERVPAAPCPLPVLRAPSSCAAEGSGAKTLVP